MLERKSDREMRRQGKPEDEMRAGRHTAWEPRHGPLDFRSMEREEIADLVAAAAQRYIMRHRGELGS
ncbi:MAG: hypothetical protein M3Z66_18995 [Chloroflexota bacterium]|nr:hypothetical protein [Chloroflexota bacterium]